MSSCIKSTITLIYKSKFTDEFNFCLTCECVIYIAIELNIVIFFDDQQSNLDLDSGGQIETWNIFSTADKNETKEN